MKEKLFTILVAIYRGLFARPSCYMLNKFLFDLSIRGLGVLNSENDCASGEAYVLEKVLSCFDHPVVLDIGANRGSYAKRTMQAVPAASLYAFEPHPATFAKLQKTAASCGFKAVNCGMGAETGTLKLYDRQPTDDGTEHASLYREVIAEIHGAPVTELEVRVSTVDTFLAEQGIERVTLLKVDTEGHEYQVLLGAQSALDAGRIDLIQIEFNEMNVVSRVFFRDFLDLLGNAYDVYRLLPAGLLPLTPYRPRLCELFAFQNLLFVRRGQTAFLGGC